MATAFSRQSAVALLLVIISFLGSTLAAKNGFVLATIDGQKMYARDNRRPALYTGDFGSCSSGDSINVNRFDAAYYKDNMTVLFHLGADTALHNESIMMYIGVYAYGESRFDLTFNPCNANIWSACPIQAGIPIEANGIIPISEIDVSGVPPIALSIPDFEGEAILRIFANSTQTEIGCFSAVLTNGVTLSYPAVVGPVLGCFTLIALLASFATAIYGTDVPEMRRHYAHSPSVLVVFSVWHHIFFSGALSMDWPSVLVAFWSNYAWAAGMIYLESMQNGIDRFIGPKNGSTSLDTTAGTGILNADLAGEYDIHQIYKRNDRAITRRDLANHTEGFSWYGSRVKPGLPLPGNHSGFAGTLAQQGISVSNAFLTGLAWLFILIAAVVFAVLAFKLTLEALCKTKLIKSGRLSFFRAHHLGYTAFTVLRSLLIGFFMITFLCFFQFNNFASTNAFAIACVVFTILLLGLGGLVGYAFFYRVKLAKHGWEPDRLNIEKTTIMKIIPWYAFSRSGTPQRPVNKRCAGSLPWCTFRPASKEESIHANGDYTKKFGWLSSRFSHSRWWFPPFWLVYEFVRAGILACASDKPMSQVFGLLAVEIIAFAAMIIIRPFGSQRLNLIVVYLLGFSKVATTALSAAFDTRFNLPRIPATIIGMVIIVIQGLLTIIVLVTIIIGAISTYFSVMRNHEQIRPKRWNPIREKYFKHIAMEVPDHAPPAPPPTPETLKSPHFNLNSVRRVPKIEHEDAEFVAEISRNPAASQISLTSTHREGIRRMASTPGKSPSLRSQVSYSNLPYGARPHLPSWSTRGSSEQYRQNTCERRPLRTSSTPFLAGSVSSPINWSLPHLNPRFARSADNFGRVSPSISPPPPPDSAFTSPIPSPPPEVLRRGSLRHMRGSPLHPTNFRNEIPALPLPVSPLDQEMFARNERRAGIFNTPGQQPQGNHGPTDYQIQLMRVEQLNKKRLLREEQRQHGRLDDELQLLDQEPGKCLTDRLEQGNTSACPQNQPPVVVKEESGTEFTMSSGVANARPIHGQPFVAGSPPFHPPAIDPTRPQRQRTYGSLRSARRLGLQPPMEWNETACTPGPNN